MKKSHVLVIEDNHDFSLLSCRALKKAGFIPIPAYSGEQALAEIAANPPDLIVMDLTLPDILPEVFLEKLRSSAGRATTPVLVASGREDIQIRTAELHCEGFLKKPFELSSLIETVSRLVSEKNGLDLYPK